MTYALAKFLTSWIKVDLYFKEEILTVISPCLVSARLHYFQSKMI